MREIIEHDKRMADEPGFCTVDGCDQFPLPNRNGYCKRHAIRYKEPPPPCSVPGCTKPQRAHQLCETHRKRKQRVGSAHPEVPIRYRSDYHGTKA